MIYTLDTNFLIDAARVHFPIKENPDFWAWLVKLGKQKSVALSEQVYKEIKAGSDLLVDWIEENRKIFVHDTFVARRVKMTHLNV